MPYRFTIGEHCHPVRRQNLVNLVVKSCWIGRSGTYIVWSVDAKDSDVRRAFFQVQSRADFPTLKMRLMLCKASHSIRVRSAGLQKKRRSCIVHPAASDEAGFARIAVAAPIFPLVTILPGPPEKGEWLKYIVHDQTPRPLTVPSMASAVTIHKAERHRNMAEERNSQRWLFR